MASARGLKLHSRGARRIAGAVFLAALLAIGILGLRTYGSYLLLRSAQQAGAPATSSIRPWMTLAYVSATFDVPDPVLLGGLGLPASTDPHTSLRRLAERKGESRLDYVARVQKIVATASPSVAAGAGASASNHRGALADASLSAVLTYGYTALGLTVLSGAAGLPLPGGVAAVVAGSLAAQGRMRWMLAALVVLVASVLGDALDYALGRAFGQGLLERHGRWLGYTAARGTRVGRLFAHWGGWTVLVTRTFVSSLSSIVSVLAGATRYAPAPYFAVTLAGRAMWTSAYLGLGYAVGVDLQPATTFLANLSGLLLALALLVASGWVAFSRAPAPAG